MGMERGRGVPEGIDEEGGGGCRAVPGGCEVQKAGSGQPGRERLLLGPGGGWGGRNGRISGKVWQASYGTGAAMAPCAAACTGGSLRGSRPGSSAARRTWGLPALLPSPRSPPRPSPGSPRAPPGSGRGRDGARSCSRGQRGAVAAPCPAGAAPPPGAPVPACARGKSREPRSWEGESSQCQTSAWL